MKKLCLVLSVLMCLLLATACNGSSSQPASSATPPSSAAPASGSVPASPEKTMWKPEKTVSIIVGASAGGGTDVVVRALAQALEQIMGGTFQVINAPGGGGGIALNQVWNAPHDGYTLVGMHEGMHGLAVSDAFPHTTEIWDMYMCCGSFALLSVHTDTPYQTFDELLEAAKNQVFNAGASTPTCNLGLKYAQLTQLVEPLGIEFNFLSYEGSAPTNVAALSKEIDIVITAAAEQIEYIKAGQFRPLVAINPDSVEVSGYGTVKSLAEWFPEFAEYPEIYQWLGLAVAKDAPQEVRDAYEAAFLQAMETDVIKQMLEATTFTPFGYTGADAEARAKKLDSGFSWGLYDAGLVSISPEEFNIPRP